MSNLSSDKTGKMGRDETISSSAKANEAQADKVQGHRELKSKKGDIKLEDVNVLTAAPDVPDLPSTDFLNSLKEAASLEVAEKIEVVRLELESERLEVERSKALADRKFWVRNFGAAITAIISLAAVLVSLSQVWVASIQKDKEIEIARTQKAKELETTVVQQDRAWKLDIAKFVLDHGDRLLGKDKAQRELVTRVMLITFPPEYSGELIDRLEAVTNSQEVRQELQNIRTTVLPRIKVNRAAEQTRVKEDVLAAPTNSTPSPNITHPTIVLPSCRCPPPFEGGVQCAWDDVAICEVINDKCETRCIVPR